MSLVKKTQIGMLVFPQMTSLDILGPFEVLARAPDCEVDLVWKDLQPIEGDTRLRIMPTQRFDTAPRYDVIVVPGGPGQTAMLEDEEFIAFLRTQGAEAGLVTSICTGSLLLAAAGLLTATRQHAIGCRWTSWRCSTCRWCRSASWWTATGSPAPA
jgi:cyclohexyl-isocyanide hydratase